MQLAREKEKIQELTESDWVHGSESGTGGGGGERILRRALSTWRKIIRSCARVYHSLVISRCFISPDCASRIYCAVCERKREKEGRGERMNED